MFFGLYADRKVLPDVDDIAARIDEATDELLRCCGTRNGARRDGRPAEWQTRRQGAARRSESREPAPQG